MSEWFEDESFWEAMYPFMFPPDRFAAAEAETEKILHLADFRGGSVLDLGCGPGRHAIPLARRGLHVTGVDRTPFLLERARERGLAENVQVEWVRADMRDFVRPERYDLVVSMFTSFGYFDERSDDIRVLRNMYRNLRPGGACLIDTLGKEVMARIFQPTTSTTMPDGSLLVQRHEIRADRNRIWNEWILIRGDRARSFGFYLRIYSGQELKERLEQVGFTDIHLYGDLDVNEYGPEASRLVVVARKGSNGDRKPHR